MKINEAMSADLKIIKELEELGWKAGDILLYQQEYQLLQEQQKEFSKVIDNLEKIVKV